MLCVLSLSGCESREDKYIRLQQELAEKQSELQRIVLIQTGLVINKVGIAPDFQQRFDVMRTERVVIRKLQTNKSARKASG